MGYFANGTEGNDYESSYCARCVNNYHDRGCYVWLLHMLWNYDQHDDEAKADALSHFIPRSETGLTNEECRMYNPRSTEPVEKGSSDYNPRRVHLKLLSESDLMRVAAEHVYDDDALRDELDERAW